MRIVKGGVVYDEHETSRDVERSYIVLLKQGDLVKLPTRYTIYSRRNRRKCIKDSVSVDGELLMIGKSGVKGLEGEYGWGGAWFKARFKDGKKTYECWIRTRYTFASIVVKNAILVEFKKPSWAGSWAGYRNLRDHHGLEVERVIEG